MQRSKWILLLKISGRLGLINGGIFACYELVRYIFESPVLYAGLAKLFYLIAYFLIGPVLVFWVIKKRNISIGFVWKFVMMLVVYLSSLLLVTVNLVVIHYGVDSDYRERIAQHSVNNIIAAQEKIARERNVKIVNSTIDLEKVRKAELERYNLQNLLLTPIKFIPLIFILSVISVTIFYTLLPRT